MSLPSLFGAIIPVLCGLLGAILSNLPVSLTGGQTPPPLLSFMVVYFWCLYRPDLMPVAVTFMIGVTQDVLSGSPLGLWTTAFIAAYALLDRQRESFAGLAGVGTILGFAVAMLMVLATVYVIAALYFWRWPPVMPLILQLGVSVVCYAVVLPLLNLLQRGIVNSVRSEF